MQRLISELESSETDVEVVMQHLLCTSGQLVARGGFCTLCPIIPNCLALQPLQVGHTSHPDMGCPPFVAAITLVFCGLQHCLTLQI